MQSFDSSGLKTLEEKKSGSALFQVFRVMDAQAFAHSVYSP